MTLRRDQKQKTVLRSLSSSGEGSSPFELPASLVALRAHLPDEREQGFGKLIANLFRTASPVVRQCLPMSNITDAEEQTWRAAQKQAARLVCNLASKQTGTQDAYVHRSI